MPSSKSVTHVDDVTANLDGSLTITVSAYMNPAVAASMAAAVVAGTVTDQGGGTVKMVITVTPGSPITQQTIQADPARSF